MQKLWFYLVRFKIYSQKTKYDSFFPNFRAIFHIIELWIVAYWLNQQNWYFQGWLSLQSYNFWEKKICEIWPPGGAAPILNISVLGRFEHVPTCLNGISQCQIDKHQKTELMEEKKGSFCSFVRKSRFCKGHSLFPLFHGNDNTYQKTKDIFFLKWGMGKKSY